MSINVLIRILGHTFGWITQTFHLYPGQGPGGRGKLDVRGEYTLDGAPGHRRAQLTLYK